MVPLGTSSVDDSKLIIHFQEVHARLLSHCYDKQDIQSKLSSYRPMNQRTICAKVYPEGVQPIKGNNCHGGESRDILHIYSDRTGKHIRHYFFNAE